MDFLALLFHLTLTPWASYTLQEVIPEPTIRFFVPRDDPDHSDGHIVFQLKKDHPDNRILNFHNQIGKDFYRSQTKIWHDGELYWESPSSQEMLELGIKEKILTRQIFQKVEQSFDRWPVYRAMEPIQKWKLIHALLFSRTQIFDQEVMAKIFQISQEESEKKGLGPVCFSNQKIHYDFFFNGESAIFQTSYSLLAGDGDFEFPPVGKVVGRLEVKRSLQVFGSQPRIPSEERVIVRHF
jgi:hypothetical protein